MRSAGPHDAIASWREFMASHQQHHQEFTRLAQHSYREAEDAWTAAKNIESIPVITNVNLAGMADYLTRLVDGGGLAAVAAQILVILIGAGIQATLGGIIALVICLGGSVDIQINY